MTMTNSLINPLGDAETGERLFCSVGNNEKPKPIICNFCSNEMEYNILGEEGNLFKMWQPPEHCKCNQSQDYWKKYNEYTERIEKECEELKETETRKERVQALVTKSNLGRRFRDRTFETFKTNDNTKDIFEKVYNYTKEFTKLEKEGRGLLFTGTVGTGKTHLAVAVANYLMYEKIIPVKYGNVTTLLGEIKSSYDKQSKESEAEIINALSKVSLLIIDDLGKEKSSEWSNSIIYSIINNRYENYKPTIVTTNLSIKELEDTVGDATVSRLIEMCDGVKMNGFDYRKTRLK